MENTQEGQTEKQIAELCQRLYQHPLVQGKGWLPNLFWRPANRENPFGSLRVNPLELEVLFAAICGENSRARNRLEQENPGRAGFIERSIAHGELPLLSFRAEAS
ncbi:hypothetical protein B1757_08470 [Acidithiobacillus marinus]|uniref:Uncharacterized protein n=1 Tax=Acidithiobacillus marinus TaxID=187490 RepID=A0A2I1DL56_9PROT|nr:hypothetical protein [Acidithiobacillus marinus]PKY10603.1 hypothetical protein B1757_08470 [Acidithiobacillus marinus]